MKEVDADAAWVVAQDAEWVEASSKVWTRKTEWPMSKADWSPSKGNKEPHHLGTPGWFKTFNALGATRKAGDNLRRK